MAGRPPPWLTLAGALPVGSSKKDKHRRSKLFEIFDPNGNGYLSLAEVDKGLIHTFQLASDGDKHVTKECKAAIVRAFQATKDKSGQTDGIDGDTVTRSEFRLLLIALERYMELLHMFKVMDASQDQRVSQAEFVRATPLLRQWGVALARPDEAFKKIDRNAGGQVLFDEFSGWALKVGLEMLEDDPEDDPEEGEELLASLHAYAADEAAQHAEELAARPEYAALVGERDREWREMQQALAPEAVDPRTLGWTGRARKDDPTTAAREDVPQWVHLAETLPAAPHQKLERKKLFDQVGSHDLA